MSRLPDRQRERIRDRLNVRGVNLDIAESWCDAWEHAASVGGWCGTATYWEIGRLWIDAQRRARKTPFT